MGKSVLTPEEILLGKALIPEMAVGNYSSSGSHAMGEREFGPKFRNRYVGNNPVYWMRLAKQLTTAGPG